jgi:hypothetical protein
MKNFYLKLILVLLKLPYFGNFTKAVPDTAAGCPSGGRAFGVYRLAATWQELCVTCVVRKGNKQKNIKQRYSSKKEVKEIKDREVNNV